MGAPLRKRGDGCPKKQPPWGSSRMLEKKPEGVSLAETYHPFWWGVQEEHMARSGAWPRVRALAWDRDRRARAVCHICGQPIDYFVKPSSTPDSYEPDHIVPVSKRPDLELDLNNIKASHRRCNRTRGDGIRGTKDLGVQSRDW